VLIDLAGHTADNRLGLFLRKPAARQISWLGYPNTVGVPAIDIRLTDDIADPSPAADARHVERLVRIADGFLAYRPRLETPDVAPGPVLRDEPPRFGCFNNACKLSDRTVELWADLLAAVPDATLLLRAEQFRYDVIRDEFRQRFAARGVDPHRIVFPAFENRLLDALAGHAEIDVALDPTPYGGTTTTCEALWMGVPVVTLAGDRHAARVGASLLTHCGLGDLVAATGADYVRIAGDLVRDRDRLSDLRASLRERLAASPVGDGRRMAAAIEAACLDAVAEA
jgi:predicted O-linked N-acetylglucosamine transferase (SPINDLY family)